MLTLDLLFLGLEYMSSMPLNFISYFTSWLAVCAVMTTFIERFSPCVGVV